ncbi:alpha/beta fold hydrolase [Kitasatospora purpeofusca]|uniref:alpha/beta fold hydrolase n=1 Tax=Kitasatospora purpeofusca TaxID=67352 RepID=UPI0038238683
MVRPLPSTRHLIEDIERLREHLGFFGHGAWLEEGQLIRDAGKLAGIPVVLVHGRHDLSCPPRTAWELAAAWPGARLHIVEDSGHAGSEELNLIARRAIEEFKDR